MQGLTFTKKYPKLTTLGWLIKCPYRCVPIRLSDSAKVLNAEELRTCRHYSKNIRKLIWTRATLYDNCGELRDPARRLRDCAQRLRGLWFVESFWPKEPISALIPLHGRPLMCSDDEIVLYNMIDDYVILPDSYLN